MNPLVFVPAFDFATLTVWIGFIASVLTILGTVVATVRYIRRHSHLEQRIGGAARIVGVALALVLLSALLIRGVLAAGSAISWPRATPHATFEATSTTPTVTYWVTFYCAEFDGSGSTASSPLAYRWDFGDNSAQGASMPNSGVTITHCYPLPGTYTVTLTVTDQQGQQDSTTQQVTVQGNG